MLTNNDIKTIRSLKDKKFRDELGLFVVEGEKMVQEALNSKLEVKAVYRVEEVGETAMSKISQFTTPSPVLALVKKPATAVPDSLRGLSIGLDSVRDPGNMGTIIRLSDWFGAEYVFCSPDCVDVFNPKVVQSTMGAIFRKKIVYCDIPELCRRYKAEGMSVYGTFLDGTDIYASTLHSEGLIVMGNESNGISRAVADEVDARLLIPSFGGSQAESLNVAVATAITLSEFRRRG